MNFCVTCWLSHSRIAGVFACPCYYYPNRAGTSGRASFVVAVDLKAGAMTSDHWIKRGSALLMSLDYWWPVVDQRILVIIFVCYVHRMFATTIYLRNMFFFFCIVKDGNVHEKIYILRLPKLGFTPQSSIPHHFPALKEKVVQDQPKFSCNRDIY